MKEILIVILSLIGVALFSCFINPAFWQAFRNAKFIDKWQRELKNKDKNKDKDKDKDKDVVYQDWLS